MLNLIRKITLANTVENPYNVSNVIVEESDKGVAYSIILDNDSKTDEAMCALSAAFNKEYADSRFAYRVDRSTSSTAELIVSYIKDWTSEDEKNLLEINKMIKNLDLPVSIDWDKSGIEMSFLKLIFDSVDITDSNFNSFKKLLKDIKEKLDYCFSYDDTDIINLLGISVIYLIKKTKKIEDSKIRDLIKTLN